MKPKSDLLRGVALLACLVALPLAPTGAAVQQATTDTAPDSGEIDELERAAGPVPREIPIALLVDLSNDQILFSREADRRFVPASVTKVMTAYTAFRLVDEGTLSLDMQVEITPELLGDWRRKGSTLFLEPGDHISVEELLLGITTVSANDASIVLARIVAGSVPKWTDMMNENARELGMADSHFGTPNGWMDDGNTFTTAHDLALLGEAMTERYPNLYGRFFGKRGMRFNGYAQDNHEMLTGRVEGGDGIKTGYTRRAGNTFLGSAERDGRRLVLVIAAADDYEVRNRAAVDLVQWGYGAFEHRVFAEAGETIGFAEVQDGRRPQLALVAPEDIAFAVPGGAREIRASIIYDGPLPAPISAGDRVATLRIEGHGMPVYERPLVARDDVMKAGVIRRIGQGIASWFS